MFQASLDGFALKEVPACNQLDINGPQISSGSDLAVSGQQKQRAETEAKVIQKKADWRGRKGLARVWQKADGQKGTWSKHNLSVTQSPGAQQVKQTACITHVLCLPVLLLYGCIRLLQNNKLLAKSSVQTTKDSKGLSESNHNGAW